MTIAANLRSSSGAVTPLFTALDTIVYLIVFGLMEEEDAACDIDGNKTLVSSKKVAITEDLVRILINRFTFFSFLVRLDLSIVTKTG
ncbi:hypothetical protein D3C81_1591660 [compost metagenome]